MKLSVNSLGIAGATVIGCWYSIFALCLQTWPYETLKLISSLYSNMLPRLESLAPYIKLSTTSILSGLAMHCLFSYIFFCSIAIIYNLSAPSDK